MIECFCKENRKLKTAKSITSNHNAKLLACYDSTTNKRKKMSRLGLHWKLQEVNRLF